MNFDTQRLTQSAPRLDGNYTRGAQSMILENQDVRGNHSSLSLTVNIPRVVPGLELSRVRAHPPRVEEISPHSLGNVLGSSGANI